MSSTATASVAFCEHLDELPKVLAELVEVRIKHPRPTLPSQWDTDADRWPDIRAVPETVQVSLLSMDGIQSGTKVAAPVRGDDGDWYTVNFSLWPIDGGDGLGHLVEVVVDEVTR
jgi:hypothetical protein